MIIKRLTSPPWSWSHFSWASLEQQFPEQPKEQNKWFNKKKEKKNKKD